MACRSDPDQRVIRAGVSRSRLAACRMASRQIRDGGCGAARIGIAPLAAREHRLSRGRDEPDDPKWSPALAHPASKHSCCGAFEKLDFIPGAISRPTVHSPWPCRAGACLAQTEAGLYSSASAAQPSNSSSRFLTEFLGDIFVPNQIHSARRFGEAIALTQETLSRSAGLFALERLLVPYSKSTL